MVGLLGIGAILALVSLYREWQVRQSDWALADQTLAIARELPAPTPVFDHIDAGSPARAQVQQALYLARAASLTRVASDRRRMLNEAAAAIDRTATARPNWGEAWMVSAFVHALRDGSDAPETRLAFGKSYDGAPYMRHAAQWRVDFGLATWDLWSPGIQQRIIDEAIWIIRILPDLREHVFAEFRKSPDYTPFLLRWREVRAGDADLGLRLARERLQKRAAP